VAAGISIIADSQTVALKHSCILQHYNFHKSNAYRFSVQNWMMIKIKILIIVIITSCSILAKGQYIKRHDRVCAEVHFNICNEIGVN
jgi:uncharacterized membrane protein